jgi:hypothetical protein
MSAEVKIDWDATFTNFDDKPLRKTADPDSALATLRFLVCQAIDAQLPEDREVKGAEKDDRYDLILRIKGKGGNAPFSKKEIDFFKTRVALVYSAWVTGSCFRLLEGTPSTNGEKAPKAE